MSHWTATTTLLAGILAFGLSGPALSVEKPPPGSNVGVAQGPIYNPKTRSYFELHIDNFDKTPNGHHNAAWAFANRRAFGKFYKGQRGKLAVVKDLETLNFVRENFRINEITWIGMRFFCKFRKLVWVTGEIQPLKSPGMWASRWYRSDARCTKNYMEYMPIYLTAEHRGPVALQAAGQHKHGTNYLVEYPAPPTETGHGEETKAKAEK